MKIVHSLGWYFPESSGGTEVYVDGLATALGRRGYENVICAAAASNVSYVWNGLPVTRYGVPAAERREFTQAVPYAGFESFSNWLSGEDADIYHQHSWTRGCGLHHLRAAKRLGLHTVVTVHVPNTVCLRGTMMERGSAPCDGQVRVDRCTRCWLEGRGLSSTLAQLPGELPALSTQLGRLIPADSRATAVLLTPEWILRRQEELRELGALADRVVAVCQWLFDALRLNGIPREKLVLNRQGIDVDPVVAVRPVDGPLRVGFLGRWDRVKGIHTLVDAIRRLPRSTAVELTIHALPGDTSYENEVRAAAAGDDRIAFAPPVQRADIGRTLSHFDVLAVPSQWLETGPLVVLEAMAVGTPVLGSNLGGIAELVGPEAGRLIPASDAGAWSASIGALVAARPRRTSLRPRSVEEVADDMSSMYRQMRDSISHRMHTPVAQ